MAPRLNRETPPPIGFPSWAEFAAISCLVLWLVGVIALEPHTWWVHLLLIAAAIILGASFWRNRSPHRDS